MDFFKGGGSAPASEVSIATQALPEQALKVMKDPSGYRAAADTVRAVNVALALKMPLLVGGEPGSGKTLLGGAVAHELGKRPFSFVVKSTTVARDLFYTFDAVRYFQAKPRNGKEPEPKDYIDYQALGLAILLALPLDKRRPFLSADVFDAARDQDLASDTQEIRRMLRDSAQRQCIAIIDEIDKAPRDLPNDILDELDGMRFRVPELGGLETPGVAYDYRPIVFITTNSERQLPDAFLRRCAFLYIDYPHGSELEAIVTSRMTGVFQEGAPLLRDIVAFYERVRKEGRLNKAPGTAELLQFLQAARINGADPGKTIAQQREIVLRGMPLLAKMNSDLAPLQGALNTWSGPTNG
jgi:MoxR-like ATPase